LVVCCGGVVTAREVVVDPDKADIEELLVDPAAMAIE
jgi:hypothetical protein